MARRVLMEEFRLAVMVPRGMPLDEQEAMRRVLDDPAFLARLLRAAKHVVKEEPALARATLRLVR